MPDKVTSVEKEGRAELLDARPMLLPFDPKELMAIRVRPAQFASMCNVSRQTVSQWGRKGWITMGPDGLVDPVAATRQLLKRADPARIRARIFREATATQGQLRARIRELEAALSKECDHGEWRETAGRNGATDAAVRQFEHFTGELLVRFDDACAAHASGTLATWLDELAAVVYYGQDLSEYRIMMAE